MKITESNSTFGIAFDQLSIGEVFKYRFLNAGETVLMKIGDAIEEINVVDLATGETCAIAEDAPCQPVGAELIIRPISF